MSISVTGQVRRIEIGMGAWAIVSDSGQTYELLKPPKDLAIPNLKVRVTGQVREDVMTAAMIGPVLEVSSFEVLA
ncbi:hypothetical protein [Pannus brasiliensis]